MVSLNIKLRVGFFGKSEFQYDFDGNQQKRNWNRNCGDSGVHGKWVVGSVSK